MTSHLETGKSLTFFYNARSRLLYCRMTGKVSLASTSGFLPLVIYVRPASASRHHGQSACFFENTYLYLKIFSRAASELLFQLSFAVIGRIYPIYIVAGFLKSTTGRIFWISKRFHRKKRKNNFYFYTTRQPNNVKITSAQL